MIKIAICGPSKSGRTTIANEFSNADYLEYDLNDYKTIDNTNPIPAMIIELRKLNNKILQGLELKGIVVHDVSNVEELEYLLSQGFEGLYVITPSREYVPTDSSPDMFDYACYDLKLLCKYKIANTNILEVLQNDVKQLISLFEEEITT